jgi:hypothetical protein
MMSGSSWSGVGKPQNGELVKCIAVKAVGKKVAQKYFSQDFSSALVEGEVLNADDARKIKVRWSLPNEHIVETHSIRVLIGAQQQLHKHPTSKSDILTGLERGMEEELCHEDGDVIMDELAGDDEPTESERLAAEGPPVESEGDNLLKPHDQLWKEIPGGVDVCWRTSWGKRKWNPVLK